MFPVMQDPRVANTIARQQIDERVRDAAARRASRIARIARTGNVVPPRPRRRWWTFVIARRATA